MAEAVISFIAQTVTKQLATQIEEQIALAWGAQGQLDKLKNTVETIKSVLLDAEEQHAKKNEVRQWVARLKDSLYDADDVLDEYNTISRQRQELVYKSMLKKVSNFCSLSNPFLFNRHLGQRVKEIREEIDEIAENKAKFSFASRNLNIDSLVTVKGELKREQTQSYVLASDVIGREEDKEAIINILKAPGDKENVGIIAIVGIGGLGKTMLAQLAYNDNIVNSLFELKIWLPVSEEFNVRKISERMMKAITLNDYSHLDVDLLQRLLRDRLSTKRYLLVLDDVWNEDKVKWHDLKVLLMNGAKGSKIIVTTRSKKVAAMMSPTSSPYELKGLPYDKCLELLLRWAFEKHQEWPKNLVEIGKAIAKKCGGLPLAARTLGCLLSMKTDERDWVQVRDSEFLDLTQNENDILPVLRLTYDQLPPYLKQCFAFCSLFPKDHVIDKETLTHLWMAQGFLHPFEQNLEEETIGSRYFEELVSRSLLEIVPGSDDTQVKYYKMHDLVRDLARMVAGTECVLLASHPRYLDKKEQSVMTVQPKNFTDRVRHMSVFGSRAPDKYSMDNEVKVSELFSKAKKLRTLYSQLLVGQNSVMSWITDLQYLRILHLSESEFKGLPNAIGELQHLRYFDISKNNHLKKLPESLCKLRNLQKLNLSDCKQLGELPRDAWKIVSLRHVGITSQQEYFSGDGMEGLTSLRSLSIHDCNRLLSLVEGMQYLTGLRKLRLSDCPQLASLEFDLSSLISLEVLEIGNCSELDLAVKGKKKAENSFRARKSLQSRIKGFAGRRAVAWEEKNKDDEIEKVEDEKELDKLRSLTVTLLPKLVKLPKALNSAANSLQYLTVSDCVRMNSLLHCDRMLHFTALQTLRLSGCPSLKSLMLRIDSLFSLETLDIRNCSALNLTGRTKEKKDLGLQGGNVMRQSTFGLGISYAESDLEDDIKKNKQEESDENGEKEEETDNGQRGLEKLHSLIIEGLPLLVELPKVLRHAATTLHHISVLNCKGLRLLPVSGGIQHLTALQTLCICDCDGLTSLTLCWNSLIALDTLEVRNCSLLDLSEFHKNHESENDEPKQEEDDQLGLEKLHSLTIAGLPKVVKLPKVVINSSCSLHSLSVSQCASLSMLYECDGIQHFTALRTLSLCDCPSLNSSNLSFSSLISLETLEIRNCPGLDFGVKEHEERVNEANHQSLGKLRTLNIAGLPQLVSFPKVIENAITSLQNLSIADCENLSSLSCFEGKQHMIALQTLQLRNLPILTSLNISLRNLVWLETLELRNCFDLDLQSADEDKKEGPHGLRRLRSVTLVGLTKLVKLPNVFKHAAASLQNISISNCPNFSYLPLWITEDPVLSRKLHLDSSLDIAH